MIHATTVLGIWSTLYTYLNRSVIYSMLNKNWETNMQCLLIARKKWLSIRTVVYQLHVPLIEIASSIVPFRIIFSYRYKLISSRAQCHRREFPRQAKFFLSSFSQKVIASSCWYTRMGARCRLHERVTLRRNICVRTYVIFMPNVDLIV